MITFCTRKGNCILFRLIENAMDPHMMEMLHKFLDVPVIRTWLNQSELMLKILQKLEATAMANDVTPSEPVCDTL